MGEQPADPDQVVVAIAVQCWNLVTYEQLRRAGLGKNAIATRIRRGWLHRKYRGVYAVGTPKISIEGRYLAAVLACGEGAVLSYQSAAGHWKVLPHVAGPIHVTIPERGSRARREGIQIHRSSVLGFPEVTRHRGIPITSPRRTIADLRKAEAPEVVRRAAREAAVLGLNIGDESGQDRTRSELERRLLWLFPRYGVPKPEVNAEVAGLIVDFLWRLERVIVETDGWRYHRGREAFESDRKRDARLRLAGYQVLRFSHRQVFHEPDEVMAVIREAIGLRSAR